jgi:NADPH:quinone reductase-like Zn-dependent oxidoreductase
MDTMKAVRIHEYGGVEVLKFEDAPIPDPGPGEVLIQVNASTVNPFDCAARSGYLDAYFSYSFPLILGTDISGVVSALGDGVTQFVPGDAVFTRAGVFRDGANAQYALAYAAEVAMKPTTVDDFQAAALPHVTLTAWQGLYEYAALEAGQRVLIHGAAGGVGHVAIQLAKLRGAHVIGTGSLGVGLLADLGVDEVINYADTAFDEVVSGVDVVFDLIGGETQERSWKVLKPGGILLATVQPPSPEKAAEFGVRAEMIASAPPLGETLTQVAALVDGGELRATIADVMPLSAIAQAHELIQGGHVHGKIVLAVDH